MKNFFADWSYKKHAKFVTAIYGVLYVIDMTLTYFFIKKINNNHCKLKKHCRSKV